MTAAVALALTLSSAAAAPRVYEVIPEESDVGFDIKTSWHEVHGTTQKVSGTVELPQGLAVDEARVQIDVDAATLDTGNESRDRDIRSKFLEAAAHPLLSFHSERLTGDLAHAGDGKEVTIEADGEFEAHGVRQPVKVSATCVFRGDRAVVTLSFPLSLKAFAIRDPSRWFARSEDALVARANLVLRLRPAAVPTLAPPPAAP